MTEPANPVASALAERIAASLGWEYQHGDNIRCYGEDFFAFVRGQNALTLWPQGVVVTGPDNSIATFRMFLFCDDRSIVAANFGDQGPWWTEENREFVRKIDGMCDGLITYALTNANETTCLDWLRG